MNSGRMDKTRKVYKLNASQIILIALLGFALGAFMIMAISTPTYVYHKALYDTLYDYAPLRFPNCTTPVCSALPLPQAYSQLQQNYSGLLGQYNYSIKTIAVLDNALYACRHGGD